MAQFRPDPASDHAHVMLVSAQDAGAPGSTVWLALRIQHDPHWHTYWVNPGDAGLPTRVSWTSAPGLRLGDIQWPLPEKMVVSGLANYGYEGTVLLPLTLAIPASAQPGTTVHLQGKVEWLVCSDMCIPGGGPVALDLPVRMPADVHPTEAAGAIGEARARVPAPQLSMRGVHLTRDGKDFTLSFTPDGTVKRLDFLPLESGLIQGAAEAGWKQAGPSLHLTLRVADPLEATVFRGVLVANEGPGHAGGWAGAISLPLPGKAPGAAVAPGGQAQPPAAPGSSQAATPVDRADAAPLPVPAKPDGSTAAAPGVTGAPDTAAPAADTLSLGLALLGAFLGGLVLNLMPCVFPVLSLKLMALVQHRSESPRAMRRHGFAYAAGVILSFLLLAGALIALRSAGSQIGWGFQLQSPGVVAALLGLFFLIGLNLLGAFEFTLGSSLVNRVASMAPGGAGDDSEENLSASFSTGVLAAVVASPCTGPFMGAALGFAMTQPALVGLSVFGALGVGMAAPYVLLTQVPAWLERLPRPGAWMEHLKQVMAFPMFLTCVWLLWVLGQQIDIGAVAVVLTSLVVLALWAWSTGLAQRGAPRYRWVARAALLAAVALGVVVLAPALKVGESPALSAAPMPGGWQPWSPAAQAQALSSHTPVFVDFTAAWCITCQANKRLVLHDERVEAAFRAHGVVRFLADWTRRDETISRELVRFKRTGVPMYLYYDAQGKPQLLPEILSVDGVIATLAAAGR